MIPVGFKPFFVMIMEAEDFNEFIGAFIAETQEFLQLMETNILALETTNTLEARLQSVKNLFRSAHSIKGSARMFGFEGLSTAAHYLEDCFAVLREQLQFAVGVLPELQPNTVSSLLHGLDHLRCIVEKIIAEGTPQEPDISEHQIAIAQIKEQFEAMYGTIQPPQANLSNQPANQEIIKVVFGNELPIVLDKLEAELSQAQADKLELAIAAIAPIHYQLSGVATMLQLPAFGEIATQLDTLINLPDLTLEQLQQQGWEIAQKLRVTRDEILQGHALTVADAQSGKTESVTTELLAVPTLAKPSEASTWQRPTIRVDVERLTELVNLVGELVINRTNLQLQENQLRGEVKRIRRSIAELNQAGSQLRQEYDLMSVHDPARGKISLVPGSHRHGTYFDNLEMDRYTQFHSTAQSIIETTQAIAQGTSKVDDLAAKFERSTEQLRRITEQLRNRVMQLRVVPFSRAVDHLPRAIRDLSRLYNKDVNLILLGRDTKIDDSLLDALRDPLVHLVRNAFDHGIESPAERQAVGKPVCGEIEIEARHQGGQTIITVTDDGKGIDPEQIRAKVVERSLVTAEQSQTLSMTELYDFLFWPGFSTREHATDLSGRGVGLDVVRTNLQQVRGTVKVDSRPGKGTSFILKLPLMLSITDALLVKIDHNILAVPMDAVEEILYIQTDEIKMAGNQPMLLWCSEFIRLARLQDLVEYHTTSPPDAPSPIPLQPDFIPVLILMTNDNVIAIAVERLLGQQEIVIKPLPAPLSKPKGIVGSTILGDGKVIPILDIDDLISEFTPQSSTAISLDDRKSQILAPVPTTQPQILIVDDSYIIRQMLSLTLTRGRYRVVQAKDGQDALEKLQNGLSCNLIITDIEMPRMDGFELLQAIKSNPLFSFIPVAILTSRSGAKHRQIGMDLGATGYFTKPYNEVQLLSAISQLLDIREQVTTGVSNF
ncbi:MAG TPA: hybrid sensor histidine kinase/response regulator [Nostocaceae cyanobacterium]|nr:hybrid sensor histidine kinase/response regulator [Nostocaceae cyanobacterium]